MPNASQLLASGLQRNLEMLKMTIADMSDDELLVRPVESANHANWQIGHLIQSERGMIAGAGADMPELPEGFGDRYSMKANASDGATHFDGKDLLLKHFAAVREGTIAFARSRTDADLDKPAPERMQRMAPTVADLLTLVSLHTMMHLGQVQVLRRKLGKPILF